MFRDSEFYDDSFGILSLRVAPFIIAPAVSVGHTLYNSVGGVSALVTIVLGSMVLYRIASLMVRLAANRRLGTMEIVQNYFGPRGTTLCALIICGACIGWSAWQINFCSKYIINTIHFKNIIGEKISSSQLPFLCLLLFFTPVFFRNRFVIAVNRFFTAALLISFTITIIFISRFEIINLPPLQWQKIDLSGLSFFLHTWIVYTLSVPSLFNTTSAIKHADKNIKIFYLFLLPFVCLFGIGQGIHWPNQELTDLRLSPLVWWQFNLMVYVVAGGFAVCQTNVVYGAEAIAKAFSLRSYTPVIIIMGLLVCVFLNQRMENSFGPSEIFKIMILTILVIIIARSFIQPTTVPNAREIQDTNSQILILATFVGLLTQTGCVSMTGVPSFDAGLTAFALSAYYSRARNRRSTSLI